MRPKRRNEEGENGNGNDEGLGRRAGPRRPLDQEVSLFDEAGEPVVLEATDLGPKGMFVRADIVFEAGEELWVSFIVPGGPKLVVKGRVVRAHLGGDGHPPGMGITFVDLTRREHRWLRRFSEEEIGDGHTWQVFLDGVGTAKPTTDTANV